MEKSDGGSAFPKTGNFGRENEAQFDSLDREGMSLRDYFAGQALIGAIVVAEGGYMFDKRDEGPTLSEIASDSYKYADAMLLAREGKASE